MKFYYSLLFLSIVCNISAQENELFIEAVEIYNPNRIEEINYKLVLYNQNEAKLSDIAILNRKIEKEDYNSITGLKITEEYTNNDIYTKTICYLNLKTLLPLYLEKQTNDTLISKYFFKKDKILFSETNSNSNNEINKELPISEGVFLSNSFSEILQSIDFSKNRNVVFSTFSPGKTPSKFEVEVIDEKKFMLPNKESIDCWLLHFTVSKSSGEVKSGGYRYIDKKSGKVLAFKTDINSNKFFTYQMNLLENAF